MRSFPLSLARQILGQKGPGGVLHVLDGTPVDQAENTRAVREYYRARGWHLRHRRSRPTLLSDPGETVDSLGIRYVGCHAPFPARLGSTQPQPKPSSSL